jgi:hypothetical protein
MKTRIIILTVLSVVPCFAARSANTITINTNTAGELADACGVKPGGPGGDTKQTFCQGFAQGVISMALRKALST